MFWYSFVLAFYFVLHMFKVIKTKKFKEKFFCFLKWINVDEMVSNFWDTELKNINKWYIDQMSDDDVIASASPEFLVRGAMQKLNAKAVLICTNMGKQSGLITGENLKLEAPLPEYFIEILEKLEE